MKKSITLWMPVLLAVVLLAVPVTTTAASKRAGTVLRGGPVKPTTPEVVIIAPRDTSAHRDLDPYDPPVIFENKWYCGSVGVDSDRRDAEAYFNRVKNPNPRTGGASPGIQALGNIANAYLKMQNKDAIHFWGHLVSNGAPFSGSWKSNPAQGETDTHTWQHCYSKQELEGYKREAVRWAKYMKHIWLPKHRSGRK